MKFDGKTIIVKLPRPSRSHGPTPKKEVDTYRVTLRRHMYQSNGRTAIVGTVGGATFGILTVNINDRSIPNDCVFVKTWMENKEFAEAALESGFFEDTGIRVKCGLAEAQVWKIL